MNDESRRTDSSQYLATETRKRSRRPAFGFVALGVLSFGAVGCERCSKSGGAPAETQAASSAPVAGPVMVLADGGTQTSVALITEAMAERVAGPMPTAGKIQAMTPMTVECSSAGQAVSPTIYGIAFADADKDLGATAHRWGGNTTSRYNPKLGAWNTADTWFFENIKIDSHDVFLGKVAEKGGRAAITVPIMGWIAKDTTSASFPVSVFGPQEKTDSEFHPDFGNGKKPDGKTLIPPGDPSRTSIKVTPEMVGEWITKMRADDLKRGKRLIYEYILDNEPGLWMNAHRDVHPEPTTYDELLEKTIAFGTAIRKADPDAIIAGPAAWGWWEYFYSAKDHDKGFMLKPDRRAHDDVPHLAWYLKKLKEHEDKTGVRILDVLDVHIYPQADGVQGPDGKGGDGGGETDRKTNDVRFRTTRSLWDRNYEDESWIKDKVYLIPRLKDLIKENYPGRGLQIGEYNFGAEHHIAGGVALAEALGRFALNGVSHAFYWTAPQKPKPAYWGFRTYTNYDGNGGHFLERIVPSSSPSGTSLFASRDEAGKKWVIVALNFSADRPYDADVELKGCASPGGLKTFQYTGGDQGFVSADAKIDGQKLKAKLPPYSITVFELATP